MANTTSATTLRTRWNRAFAVLFVVVALAATANALTTRVVIGAFRSTAERVERDAALRAGVRSEIEAYGGLAHRLVDGEEVDQVRVAASEASVRLAFEQGRIDADGAVERELLERAHDRWELVAAGPLDGGAPAPDAALRHRWVDAGTDEVAALLSQVGAADRVTTSAALAQAAKVEKAAMVARFAFGILLGALILRFARRLSTEVLRPLALLRDSANQLAAGRLDHRVAVDRGDEIGQLAARFNAMADAIAGNQRRLSRQAHQDSLTGLANRAAFYAQLEAALAVPERRERTQAVLFVDLDDFKDVNDTLGHAGGDELLRVVASRLADTVRPGDLVARLSGDEFAILLDGYADPAVAFAVAERAVAAVSEPVNVAGTWIYVGVSVGLAVRRPGSDPGSLVREADLAMYTAKGHGKNRVERYDPTVEDAALDAAVAGYHSREIQVAGSAPC